MAVARRQVCFCGVMVGMARIIPAKSATSSQRTFDYWPVWANNQYTMREGVNNNLLFLAIFVIAGVEFLLDIATPLGISDWVWYFIPLLLSIHVGSRVLPYLLAGLFSSLILLGFDLSPPGVDREIALIGRLVGITALWLMAMLISRRKEMEENLRIKDRALKTISECNQVLVRATTESDLLQDLCRLIIEKGGYRMAWVGYAENDENKTVRVVACAGCDEGYLQKSKITWSDAGERGRGPVGTAVRTGQITICHDFQSDPAFAPWREEAAQRGFASVMALPLRNAGKVFGVLVLYAAEVDAFNATEVELLTELADDLAYGIQALRTRAEHQQAETAIRRSEARLNFALQTIRTGAWEMDLQNHTAHRTFIHDQIFGYTTPVTEWNYVKFLGHVLAEDRAEVDRRFHEATAAQADWHFECRIRRTDGAVRWIWAAGSHERGAAGEPVRMAGVVQDITERKLAEEKIHEQARMLDLAHDAITIRDLDQRIIYWNHGAERVYGWSRAEAAGQTAEELVRLDPFKVAAARRQLLEKGYWNGELTARAKDGHELVVEATWTLVRDAAGRPQSIFATSQDITETRRLEQQAARSQRIESLGTLASGVVHDLNNILTPIMVSIGLLKEQTKDPMLLRLLGSLDASTQRGAQLVKQILTFGRGVKGERIPLDLRQVAREIRQLVQETFPKSVEFEIDAPADLWLVTGDPTQFHQVLLNLAINARDAMPAGGKLTIAFQNHAVDPVYAGLNPDARVGPHVLVQVTDTGTGIAPEIIGRIFDPFFTTKPPGLGTGLGLATTFGIIKSHGGFINVYSEPGKGSTFKFYLPASATGEQAEQQAVSQGGLPRGRNEIILLVDDEEAICSTVKKILERHGYRVLTAANGAEAVSIYAARGAEIAAVITDMHMPVMDGPATIVALLSMNPRVRIIGSSGLAANGGVAKAASAGIRHFVPKPYTAEKMLRTIRDILDNGSAPESSAPEI